MKFSFFFQYLGNLDRVSGVSLLEPGKYYKLSIVKTHSVVFPGEIFPLIIRSYFFENPNIDPSGDNDGCIFGIIFPNVTGPMKKKCIYGVTCQIYEKGSDGRGTTSIKSRACQRFIIEPERNKKYIVWQYFFFCLLLNITHNFFLAFLHKFNFPPCDEYMPIVEFYQKLYCLILCLVIKQTVTQSYETIKVYDKNSNLWKLPAHRGHYLYTTNMILKNWSKG